MNSVCRRRSVGSKDAPKRSVKSVSSVREKTFTKYASSPVGVTSHITPLPAGEGLGEGPLSCELEMCAKMLSELRALCERKTPHCEYPTIFLSQKNTEEQNSQRCTETLSQPISQNVTATFSWNVLWILYAGGVLWVRNVGWNVLLNLWVLWEKKISFVKDKTPHTTPQCSFSHRKTQKNRTHKLSQRH